VAVTDGAALGWVQPPTPIETDRLLTSVATGIEAGDCAAVVALVHEDPTQVSAFGYWQRYARPTHRVQADLPVLVVAAEARGTGLGGDITDTLIESARAAGIEQLTLDARGDNTTAHALWHSRGFVQYGQLNDFVAVGDDRYDKTFWVLDLRS
jgi:ribosomal protein S18 acetylase RimI-like enzyme